LPECKICANPLAPTIVRMVLQGKLTLKEAAARLKVSDKTLWHHIKHHESQRVVEEEVPEDLVALLRYLLRQLKFRIGELLAMPVQPSSERIIVVLCKELRELVMALARLERKLPSAPPVQVTIMQKFETAILSLCCPKCKERILSYLEVER